MKFYRRYSKHLKKTIFWLTLTIYVIYSKIIKFRTIKTLEKTLNKHCKSVFEKLKTEK